MNSLSVGNVAAAIAWREAVYAMGYLASMPAGRQNPPTASGADP